MVIYLKSSSPRYSQSIMAKAATSLPTPIYISGLYAASRGTASMQITSSVPESATSTAFRPKMLKNVRLSSALLP